MSDNPTIKNLISIAPKHCDLCGNKYTNKDFSIIKNANGHTLVHLVCPACKNSYLLNIHSPMSGMIGSSRSHLKLDISSHEEMKKFLDMPTLSLNKALDLYDDIINKVAFSDFDKQKK